MTRDDILRMAREAGWSELALSMIQGGEDEKRLERFAALVAAAEREECAKLCDARLHAGDAGPALCAAAIRARGTK